MTWTLVQTTGVVTGTTATTNLSLAGVAAGNMLVCSEAYYQGANTNAPGLPTDSNGTFQAAKVPAPNVNIIAIGVACWFEPSTAAGTHNVAITNAAAGHTHAIMTEWHYSVAGAQTLDQTNTASGGSAVQTLNSGLTGALSSATDLCIVLVGVGSGTGVANAAITDPPAGFTSLGVGNNTATDLAYEQAYQILAANTSLSASWSWTDGTSESSQALIATFQPPVAAAPPTLMGQILT